MRVSFVDSLRGATEPENRDYAGKSVALGSLSFLRAVHDVVKSQKASNTAKTVISVEDEDQDMEADANEVILLS